MCAISFSGLADSMSLRYSWNGKRQWRPIARFGQSVTGPHHDKLSGGAAANSKPLANQNFFSVMPYGNRRLLRAITCMICLASAIWWTIGRRGGREAGLEYLPDACAVRLKVGVVAARSHRLQCL